MSMYQSFLIKYAEIGVKGKNRYVFEDKLVSQIVRALSMVDGEFNVFKQQGRVYVTCEGEYDYDGAVTALSRVFGVSAFCPCFMMEKKDAAGIVSDVVDCIRKEYDNPRFSFKVFCRRIDKKFPVESMDMAARIGEALLENFEGLTVDVHSPEVAVNVEIREQLCVYSKEIKGVAGMPVGTAGSAMLLLSGGIDSPVAGYMIAKRGVKINATYFHAPPYTSERAKQKVVDLAKEISLYTGPIKLRVVNFTDIQLAIYQNCPPEELTIIMRRYMMRIAQDFAKEDGCEGLITGESIGQVASQTMQSLMCTNAVCDIPVYRPLIGFDKQEIVDISQKIDTYETSILPYEDCCTIFVAKHPVTKPRLDIIEKNEKKLVGIVEELYKKAIESVEIIEIS